MKVYAPGQKLHDAVYGNGVVLTADAEYTTIRFHRHGIKKFITSMLRMEAIEAPKRQAESAEERGAVKPAAKMAGKSRRPKPRLARSPKRAARKARPAKHARGRRRR